MIITNTMKMTIENMKEKVITYSFKKFNAKLVKADAVQNQTIMQKTTLKHN